MNAPYETSSNRPNGSDEQALAPELRYPGVRPEVARLLAEGDRRIAALELAVDRATEDWNRPRGWMGKLFGLRTHVG